MEILNTKYKSVRGSSSDNYIRTAFTNNQRLLPYNDIITTIDEGEVYNEERKNCNKLRLIVTINPLCSNVLFNRITEVVYKEGSSDCKLLNGINPLNGITSLDIIGKYPYSFNTKNNLSGSVTLTRDTQLTRFDDIDYKCGVDIFNNHILRSQTFKSVCQSSANNSNFNTLFDEMREWDGSIVNGYETYNNSTKKLHLYLAEEVLTYDESVDTNLIEENGWLGFKNIGKILTYDENDALPINRVINNKPSCGFIDMCPSRDLWYFTPKYNKNRNRYEKNWNYCLTYPSEHTTKNISFIDNTTKGLKVYYFDDEVSASSSNLCKVVSFSKHGLAVDDVVNLYFETDTEQIIKSNLFVTQIYDEYSFAIKFSPQDWITEKKFITWDTESTFNNKIKELGLTELGYTWDKKDKRIVTDDNNNRYVVFNSNDMYKSNLDSTIKSVSFKQVFNGEEAEYYVRIFSKIPNWKFAEEQITDYMTQSEKTELIEKYSKNEYDFDNSIGKAAFAKNSYGDDITQIVFTDDIVLDDLVDNLGRPVTDIFLTIVKNNAGYRKWYGKNKTNIDCTSSDIEYSHVFGKNSCAFELYPLSVGNTNHQNIFQNNNLNKSYYSQGLNIASINKRSNQIIEEDEIEVNKIDGWDGDTKFYGDLCMYVPSSLAEVTIDDVWFRFNTAQRELTPQDTSYDVLNYLAYDEILSDDYDASGFQVKTDFHAHATMANEGYKYKPHYKIPVKTFSKELQTALPRIVGMKSINKNNIIYDIVTDGESYVEKNNEFVIFNKLRNKYYICEVVEIKTPTNFLFKCNDENPLFFDNPLVYSIIKKQETIPSNAILLKDGSLQYAWREVLQNGFDSNSLNETYPFTNGALYIEKGIRFFCKRQDPNKYLNSMSTTTNITINDVEPNITNIFEEDNYYDSDDINCFN